MKVMKSLAVLAMSGALATGVGAAAPGRYSEAE